MEFYIAIREQILPHASICSNEPHRHNTEQKKPEKKMYKWHDVYRTQEQEALIDSDRSQGSGYL